MKTLTGTCSSYAVPPPPRTAPQFVGAVAAPVDFPPGSTVVWKDVDIAQPMHRGGVSIDRHMAVIMHTEYTPERRGGGGMKREIERGKRKKEENKSILKMPNIIIKINDKTKLS